MWEACEKFHAWVCCQLKSLEVTAENLVDWWRWVSNSLRGASGILSLLNAHFIFE